MRTSRSGRYAGTAKSRRLLPGARVRPPSLFRKRSMFSGRLERRGSPWEMAVFVPPANQDRPVVSPQRVASKLPDPWRNVSDRQAAAPSPGVVWIAPVDEQSIMDGQLPRLQDKVHRLTQVKAPAGDFLVYAEQISANGGLVVCQDAVSVGSGDDAHATVVNVNVVNGQPGGSHLGRFQAPIGQVLMPADEFVAPESRGIFAEKMGCSKEGRCGPAQIGRIREPGDGWPASKRTRF